MLRVMRLAQLLAAVLGFLGACPGCGADDPKGLSDEAKRERIEAMYREFRGAFPDAPEVTVSELLAMQKKEKVILVDTREPREREVSMIPGAVSLEQFQRDLDSYREGPVVFYCTIGQRSGLQTQKYRQQKLQALNLKGSILSWVHAGQKAVNEGGETRKVHVYGPEWNLLPQGYEGVW